VSSTFVTRNGLRAVPDLDAVAATEEPTARRTRRGRVSVARTDGGTFGALFALVAVLNLLGLVMVLSASAVTALYDYGSPWYQFLRQFIWLIVGSTALLFTLRVDYHRWRRWTRPALFVSLGLLVLVLVPGVGVNVNGASRWLGYGPLSLQPSEMAKLAMVLFAADLLARRGEKVRNWRLGLQPVMVVFGVVAALFMLQPNLGTTAILAAILLVMLFVAGTPPKPLGVVVVGLGALGAMFALVEPYRFRRLMAFRDPWADPLNAGFQTVQSQTGIANGGLLGTGLGEGRAKWGFLPEAHTDFIYAIIGEELGLLGALTVVGLFVALGLLGVRTALRAPDRYGMLLATGVTTWILVQAFVNIGAVVGVLPITGVPLPFVSAGGSSLLFTMAAAGILLNVARRAR
jgi:cell division protein FtsW